MEVVPYSSTWPRRFQELRAHLEGILANPDVRIEHVGSTSVPGLAAKPILDVDIILPNAGCFEPVKASLEANGYRHAGDLGIVGREAFKAIGESQLMRHNLYVLVDGADELRRHLTFRDWLRAHPLDREAYAQAKLTAAIKFPDDIDAYIDAKSDAVYEIYQRCGLLRGETPKDFARMVMINRYQLNVIESDCQPLPNGMLICLLHTAQGDYHLAIWEQNGSTESALEAPLPIPTASGQRVCRLDSSACALFYTRQDALSFLDVQTTK